MKTNFPKRLMTGKPLVAATILILLTIMIAAGQSRQQRDARNSNSQSRRAGQSQANQRAGDTPVIRQPPAPLSRQNLNPFEESADGSSTRMMNAVIYLGIPLALLGLFIWLLVKSFSGDNVGRRDSHGSASAATKKDLKEFSRKAKDGLQAGEFAIGEAADNPKIIYATPPLLTYRHALALGLTGAGKSRAFYLPNLEMLATTGASVFVNDTKSELWNLASGYWKTAVRFAPDEPDASSAINWIPLCTDNNQLLTLKLAKTIVTNGGESFNKDAFWDKAATALIAALFAHVATTETPTPAFVYDIFHERDMNGVVEILFNSKSRIARQQARVFWDAGERLRGGIFTDARVALGWLGDSKVRRFTSSTKKAMSFAGLKKNGAAVFWCLPSKRIAELRPLTSLVLVLMLEQIKEKKGNPVYLMLDEFANMGAIPNFSTEITLLRSEEIAVFAGLQSFSQLVERYGHEAAKTIFENFQTKLILPGAEVETAERISKHLGDSTVIENRVSKTSNSNAKLGNNTSTTTAVQKHARRLMTANEITQLKDDQVLVVSSNRKPFFAKKWYWNKEARANKAAVCGAEITGELSPMSLPAELSGKAKNGNGNHQTAEPMPKPPKFSI